MTATTLATRPGTRPAVKDDGAPAAAKADPAGKPPDPDSHRGQRAWVPWTAALLTALIGLSDILNILRPDLVNRFHRFNNLIPGTLTTVTRSADVLIGLMLLMLAHGLRRRKRRAWQAVAALLAFDVAIHFIHSMRIPTAVVAIVVLVALLYFRDEFYAGATRGPGGGPCGRSAACSWRTSPSA